MGSEQEIRLVTFFFQRSFKSTFSLTLPPDHELTINEPRNSPARRQQFLVICTIMAAVFLHSLVMAGGFQSVPTSPGIFDGGEFCYKYTVRDYAASMSLLESIGNDVGPIHGKSHRQHDFADVLYTLYMDAPKSVAAEHLRFAVGHLAQTSNAKKINHDVLLKKNKAVVPPTPAQLQDLPAHELWPKLPYKSVTLPKVNALVSNFPFTDGFVSALLFTYKVMPAILQQARQTMKEPIVVISTCSASQQMCTHYAVPGKTFLLGQPDTATYASGLPSESFLPWTRMKKTLQKPLVWLGLTEDLHSEEL
jgi:hypothetical protein